MGTKLLLSVMVTLCLYSNTFAESQQTLKGQCDRFSSVEEGQKGTQPQKNRFYCDSATIIRSPDYRQATVTFEDGASHHPLPVALSGEMDSANNVLAVRKMSFKSSSDKWTPAEPVKSGSCQITSDHSYITNIGCLVTLGDDGYETVLLISFNVTKLQ